jgi:hypothetical protein
MKESLLSEKKAISEICLNAGARETMIYDGEVLQGSIDYDVLKKEGKENR